MTRIATFVRRAVPLIGLAAMVFSAPAQAAAGDIKAKADLGTCSKPAWPEDARQAKKDGAVTLEFTVGVNGELLGSKVLKSSGTPSLDQAADEALSRCKFHAAVVDGKPAQDTVKVKYVWKLG